MIWRFVARLMAALTGGDAVLRGDHPAQSTVCRVLLDGPGGFDTAAVAATLAGAWVVGFVIPGASAGIGVREAAVILLLSPALGAGDAAVIAAIYRLVTAGGDALFAALGGLVRRSARLTFLTRLIPYIGLTFPASAPVYRICRKISKKFRHGAKLPWCQGDRRRAEARGDL